MARETSYGGSVMTPSDLDGSVIGGSLGEWRSAHTTAGGDAMSTTPTFIQFPVGAKRVYILVRSLTTAVVAQIAKCPWLTILKTEDSLATITDYSANAQDADAATDVTLSSIPAAADGGYLYVGSWMKFRGVYIDVDAVNGTASALTVKYWNGSGWAATTGFTDNTGGATSLANDGTVVWAVPTDWATAGLSTVGSPASTLVFGNSDTHLTDGLYWTRWQWATALDSATTLNSMTAMPPSTKYFELAVSQQFEELVDRGTAMYGDKSVGGYSGIEHRTDAGTGALIVNVATNRNEAF